MNGKWHERPQFLLSLHAYASRDSPPSHTLLDQNLDPRVFDVKKLVITNLKTLLGNTITKLERKKWQRKDKYDFENLSFELENISSEIPSWA